MGFFSNFIRGAKQLNRVATVVGKVKVMLDNIEDDPNAGLEAYIIAAWVCRAGILDVIESESMLLSHKMFVNINGYLANMTLAEALAMSTGRLSIKAGRLSDSEQEVIDDILEKGEWFYKVDRRIPDDVRAIVSC